MVHSYSCPFLICVGVAFRKVSSSIVQATDFEVSKHQAKLNAHCLLCDLTRKNLSEVHITQAPWLQTQMVLPLESHCRVPPTVTIPAALIKW